MAHSIDDQWKRALDEAMENYLKDRRYPRTLLVVLPQWGNDKDTILGYGQEAESAGEKLKNDLVKARSGKVMKAKIFHLWELDFEDYPRSLEGTFGSREEAEKKRDELQHATEWRHYSIEEREVTIPDYIIAQPQRLYDELKGEQGGPSSL